MIEGLLKQRELKSLGICVRSQKAGFSQGTWRNLGIFLPVCLPAGPLPFAVHVPVFCKQPVSPPRENKCRGTKIDCWVFLQDVGRSSSSFQKYQFAFCFITPRCLL